MLRPVLLLALGGLAAAAPDKSEKKTEAKTDSYNSPVGTSYTVPLTASYSAPVSAETRKYSVSADDLERADLSVSSSLTAPVYSGAYKAQPTINTYLEPGTNSVQQAEARDGGGHHGEGHHGHHAEHSQPAPAVAAPEPAFQAAPVSQGNLYYYYYPVQAEPIVEKSDDELDPLVLVLLPITLLVGLLAILSVINVSVTGRAGVGRSFAPAAAARENPLNAAFGSFDQLKAEVDRMLERYYHALESESCMDRVVCELGSKAKDLSGRNMLLTALDWIIPTHMSSRITTFKAAVNEGYEVHHCKQQFQCDSQRLIQTTRK